MKRPANPTSLALLALLLAAPLQADPTAKTPAPGEQIAWFSTLDSALAEAKRTQRPIFLLAARPECRGIPGFW